MNDNATYYIDFITKYFSGEITEEELRLLSGWLKADTKNEVLFGQYLKTWQLIEQQKIQSSISPGQEWITFRSKITATASEDENPAKIIPLHQNGRSLKRLFRNAWKVAAASVILMVASFLLYTYMARPALITVTARASNMEQVLPDGSVITLHAGSRITYPDRFASSTRNVELHGEAYFIVSHDKTKPFVVASGDARVEVLGTQFNVNTQAPANTMEVVLTTGKVSVYYIAKPQENVLLMPGEKARFTGQHQISKVINTDPNYMAWKSHVLVFDNETLSQVINTLQNVYQAPLKIVDLPLSECRVTATFNDQSLQSVLKVITETLNLQVRQNGKVIELSGSGCR